MIAHWVLLVVYDHSPSSPWCVRSLTEFSLVCTSTHRVLLGVYEHSPSSPWCVWALTEFSLVCMSTHRVLLGVYEHSPSSPWCVWGVVAAASHTSAAGRSGMCRAWSACSLTPASASGSTDYCSKLSTTRKTCRMVNISYTGKVIGYVEYMLYRIKLNAVNKK